LITAFIVLNLKTNFEKPKFIYEDSPDLNSKGIDVSNNNFFINNSNGLGVLLVHGLGASPYQTTELASFLAEKNITVYSIRLSGHGTNLTDFESKKWTDWYKDTEDGYSYLKTQTKKAYIIGISSGALLALSLAEKKEVDGLVAIAAPLYLKDWRINLLPIIQLYQRYRYFGVDSTQIGHAYENIPTKTLYELRSLVWSTIEGLSKITEPVMIVQSTKDKLVYPKSAEYAFKEINTTNEKILMTSINHAVIRAYENESESDKIERQKVFNEIYNFIIQ
jgi:carboxylesterase